MEQHKQSLDEFLQDKVETANFQYDEKYWKKMSEMLDDEEKKRPFAFFWRGFTLLMTLVILGTGAYIIPKLSKQSKKDISKKELYYIQDENKADALGDDVKVHTEDPQHATLKDLDPLNSSNTSEGSKSMIDQPAQQVNRNQYPATQEQYEINETQKSDAVKAEGNSHKDDSAHEVSAAKASIQQAQTGNESKFEQDNHQASGMKELSKEKSKIRRKRIEKSDEAKRTNSSTEAIVATSQLPDNKINAKDQLPKTNNQSVSVLGKNMKPVDTIKYDLAEAIDQSIYNPRYISSLKNYVPEKLDSVTVINYQTIPESKESTQKVESNISEPKQFISKPEWIVLAGLNANKGLKGNISSPLTWAFSPYLGVGIEKKITTKLSMASHVGFTYFNGLNSEIKLNSTQYSFGLDSSSFAVAHKKLLQLYLPVSIYQAILKNHFLMASIGLSYSFDVSSRVTEQTMSNNTGYTNLNARSAVTKTSTESGYRDGYKAFDVFAQIGYSYSPMKHLMLQLIFQQGFTDITKNNYFNNQVKNTQSRISLGLKYNFIKN